MLESIMAGVAPRPHVKVFQINLNYSGQFIDECADDFLPFFGPHSVADKYIVKEVEKIQPALLLTCWGLLLCLVFSVYGFLIS